MGSLSELIEVVKRERGALVMGVVNATPDSFFDGGHYYEPRAAEQRVDHLLAQGADIIDIGAESTRPGSEPVESDEQLRRMEPALRHAVSRGAIVSIDTQSPAVARQAARLGAAMINDVSCLADAELARVAQEEDCHLLIMHSRGAMREMPGYSHYPESAYEDVVEDVRSEWEAARQRALAEGLSPKRIWFDPGLGFHKSASQSTELLQRLEEFESLGAPMAIGSSRKSFIGKLDGSKPADRLGGTVASCLRAVEAGVLLLRVHDVHDVRQAVLARRAFAPRRRGPSHA